MNRLKCSCHFNLNKSWSFESAGRLELSRLRALDCFSLFVVLESHNQQHSSWMKLDKNKNVPAKILYLIKEEKPLNRPHPKSQSLPEEPLEFVDKDESSKDLEPRDSFTPLGK